MTSIPTYFIGLIFGLIYVFLFDGNAYLERIEKSIWGLAGLICGTFFLILFSFLFPSTPSKSGLLATNASFQILMAVFFFISSLYFFGFLKFNNPKIYTHNSTKFQNAFSGIEVFLNFQFFWLVFSAYFISLTVVEIPASVPLIFGGFYTAILFGFFSFQNQKTG